MAEYLGQRIIDGAYTYAYVIGKRADLKSGIDTYLTEKDRTDLITATTSAS
ncbi:hypothetical protein [Clostridium beijerinckii]|uniref:hypothetical protein n=1 Tax=Clostridium beijerinckii TaxID=1520 RepID=UPI001865785E|nr:hypothetical protein [Clostridium beijerinckii]